MKKTFAVIAFAASTLLLSAAGALAQTTAPDFPSSARPTRPGAGVPDNARTRQQQQMSPEEAARDQQLQLLESRTGNTSFGSEKGGPYRQLDKAGGGFTVRKFKALPGQDQKRGESRRVPMGARTNGKPLVHDHGRKKKFLLF